jgi:hypothetical protein
MEEIDAGETMRVMKAKDLAKRLLEHPEDEVVLLEWDTFRGETTFRPFEDRRVTHSSQRADIHNPDIRWWVLNPLNRVD